MDFQKLIDAAVEKYGLPPEYRQIGYRQLMQESGGKLDAVSKAGARGPWQFMPKTAQSYGLQDPTDPIASTDKWGQMMSELHKQTGGNPAHVLAAYNWGIGNLNKHGMQKAPQETRDYVSKILGSMQQGGGMQEAPASYAPALMGAGAKDAQAAINESNNRIPTVAMATDTYMPNPAFQVPDAAGVAGLPREVMAS